MTDVPFVAKIGFVYRKAWIFTAGDTNHVIMSVPASGGEEVVGSLKFDRQDNCEFSIEEKQDVLTSSFQCRGAASIVGGFFSRRTRIEFAAGNAEGSDLVLEWNAVAFRSIIYQGRELDFEYFGSTREVNFKCDAISVRLTFQMMRREGRLTVERSGLTLPFEYALLIGAIAWRIEEQRFN